MKTRLPISTISFNTEAFLKGKLEELRKAKILSEWYYIKHKGEDDEAGTKDHFHVFMMPSRAIQTDDLVPEFFEYDPKHPDKPLKTLRIQSSIFSDWYLYGEHNKAYLAKKKNQTRRFQYSFKDFVAYDDDIFLERYREINITEELGGFAQILQAQELGLSFEEFCGQGRVPVQQFLAYKGAWEMLLEKHKTDRGNSKPHAVMTEDNIIVDPLTGEVADDNLLQEPK